MIITITNSKGGVMKTTLAIHLATWFYIHLCKVLFVDADPQRLGHRWAKAINSPLELKLMTNPRKIYEQLPKISSQYDAVVVDAPGGMNDITGAILHVADNALIPTGGSYLDLEGSEWTIETIKNIQQQRSGLPNTGLIATRYKEGTKTASNLESIAKSLKFGFVKSGIPHKEIIAQARGIRNDENTGWKSEPSLIWDMGRRKEVRTAALWFDTVFQEIFAGACLEDPDRIIRMVTPKSQREHFAKENHGKKLVSNG